MYYKLSPEIALRSWKLVPYAYYIRGDRYAKGLKKEEFDLLCQCNGRHPIERNELLLSLERRGLCQPCEAGEDIEEWQKRKVCSNRYFPAVNWAITGKCNYNCLHCFMAADNAPLMSQFSWEECKHFIEECEQCGIQSFTLTGGEPMLHPQFLDILREIHRRGMRVIELNTNGSLITEEILLQMKEIGCKPQMKISFDGIGHHNWLRNHRNAEEKTLTAIKACLKEGFSVKVQTNVHKYNVDAMLATAEYMDSLGVDQMRIIRTSESPRWAENAGDACLSITEYYDTMLKFTSQFIEKPHRMAIDIWQFLLVYPDWQRYSKRPLGDFGPYRDSYPVCRGNRGMVAVTANGNVFPCNQMSGYYEKNGDHLGNVKTDGLKMLLTDSRYLDEISHTVGELRRVNQKCGACQYFERCRGGCRAIALALTGDKMAPDPAKCAFFEGGYLEKTDEIFQKNEEKTGVSYQDTKKLLKG